MRDYVLPWTSEFIPWWIFNVVKVTREDEVTVTAGKPTTRLSLYSYSSTDVYFNITSQLKYPF